MLILSMRFTETISHKKLRILAKNLDSFQLNEAGLLKDFKLSFGIGLPIPKNMSQLNLSCQIGRRGTSQGILISERYINFIFSMTFNDKWFNKRKIQ